jgi:hypothetical protein
LFTSLSVPRPSPTACQAWPSKATTESLATSLIGEVAPAVSNSPPTTQRPFQSVDASAAVASVGPVTPPMKCHAVPSQRAAFAANAPPAASTEPDGYSWLRQ